MADVSVKMGVSGISQFRSEITQAQASVKTYDSALKLAEKQFRATGNAQQFMQNKTTALQGKLAAQQSVVKSAEAALKSMTESGVNPASAAYQRMQQNLLNAQAAVLDTQNDINNLGTASAESAGKTDQLVSSLGGLNKKISLEQVISGVNKITEGMEKAAAKAVELGKSIWDNIMDSAAYADDTATMAARMGLTNEEVQRMQYVANRFEAPVETVAKAWKKVKMSMSSDSDEIMEDFRKLGLTATQTIDTGFGLQQQTVMRYSNYKDVFWATGEAIMNLRDEEERERMAQKLLGRSWDELIPLFKAGRQAYEDALDAAPTNSEDAINNAAELNDKVAELEQSFRVLKTEVIGEIAPALKGAAETLEKLITSITEYLRTDEGQEMLEKLGQAVEGLFSDLSQIDPQQVVDGFTDVFTGIVDGMKWLVENKDTVIGALEGIVIGWGMLELTGGALQVLKLVNGIRELGGFKGVEKGINDLANNGQQPRTTTTPPAPKVPSGGSTAEAIAAAEALHLGGGGASAAGIGTGIGGAGTLSLVGALGGSALIVGGTVALAELVKSVNRAAEESRKVDMDVNRFSAVGGPLGDKRLVLQTAVRGIMGTNGMRAEDQLKWLSYNLNSNILDAFMYDNGNKNKLIDMLGMDPQNAAAAYQIMKWAGYTQSDSRLTQEQKNAYNSGQAAYMQIKDSGGQLGYEWALESIRSYFNQSGIFNENGEWTIPGLEEDLAAQTAAAEAMQSASQTMESLPAAVAEAVSGVKLQVSLFGMPGMHHANGIWSVPFDGYHALLHKGERVVPEREVNSSRTFNSNLYVESMYMNNGQDVDGLAARVAAENRRIMSGYGS